MNAQKLARLIDAAERAGKDAHFMAGFAAGIASVGAIVLVVLLLT